MAAARVFIDGAVGTTGLEIRERLSGRAGITLLALEGEARKDPKARGEALNDCDMVILCLPDDAAREAVSLITNPNVRVIDASSAHRTAEGWVYGFAELEKTQRDALRHAMRVTNPGCWPTGFLALMRPVVRAGLVPPNHPITVGGMSGYSGGGKGMITEFEDAKAANYTEEAVRTYGLNLEHKHVEEMRIHAGLVHRPLFAPNVGRYYRGMLVEVPLQLWALPSKATPAQLHDVLSEAYRGEKLITVAPLAEAEAVKTLDVEELKGTDRLKLYVFGNAGREQARLIAVLDNLGKGAGGAAVQNLNVMMGWNETEGLVL
jgi:N-acetyl-gamma-glutamyl-phosphate reductase